MGKAVLIDDAFRSEELHDGKIHFRGFTEEARVARSK